MVILQPQQNGSSACIYRMVKLLYAMAGTYNDKSVWHQFPATWHQLISPPGRAVNHLTTHGRSVLDQCSVTLQKEWAIQETFDKSSQSFVIKYLVLSHFIQSICLTCPSGWCQQVLNQRHINTVWQFGYVKCMLKLWSQDLVFISLNVSDNWYC